MLIVLYHSFFACDFIAGSSPKLNVKSAVLDLFPMSVPVHFNSPFRVLSFSGGYKEEEEEKSLLCVVKHVTLRMHH